MPLSFARFSIIEIGEKILYGTVRQGGTLDLAPAHGGELVVDSRLSVT
jgi:hypothetical protein